METIWKPNMTVATIVEQDGRFLIVEEETDAGIVFNQPAGHLDEGETLEHAAVRETYEETAWRVQVVGVVGVYQWRKPPSGPTFVRVCFAAQGIDFDNTATLDKEIIRTHWLSRKEVQQRTQRLRSPMVLRCIDDYLAGRRFPLNLITNLA